MALTPVRETIGAVRDVFLKVFELYTGGFSINTAGFTKDEVLPRGSLVKVDESTRYAAPIKTAVASQTSPTGYTHYVEAGHHFSVGDYIALTLGGRARKILTITSTASGDKLDIGTSGAGGTGIGVGATGAVFFDVATAIGTAEIKVVPNGILRYDTTIATGEFATVALRGSVYKERIQAHVEGHLANLSHIHFSESK